MGSPPSLFTLCMKIVAREILHDDYQSQDIFELPSDLFDCLLTHLSPLALHKLCKELSFSSSNNQNSTTFFHKDGRKRERFRSDDFSAAWEMLFKLRWPDGIMKAAPSDLWIDNTGIVKHKLMEHVGNWQQIYCERHLQSCLDVAAEIALLPSFEGCIGDITIPEAIMKLICCERLKPNVHDYSKLAYHCLEFGCYARCLKLQSVLCVEELVELLWESKLQELIIRRIWSANHVTGACKLLKKNNQTLRSLEFIHCRMSQIDLGEICHSLFSEDRQVHGVEHFVMKSSVISNFSLPSTGLLSFLTLGRSLKSVTFTDCHLVPDLAKALLDVLVDSSISLSSLDLSENNIQGWLSKEKNRSLCFHSASCKSLNSLRILSLRGNNLHSHDAADLKHALVYMPNLQCLDLSDNPIGDSGIRSIIQYLNESYEKEIPLIDIKIENCNLSFLGVTELLKCLSERGKSLKALSLADNDLGSGVAIPLANFLGTSCLQEMKLEDIGLGPSGFHAITEAMPEKLELVNINISKNRGGMETARFVAKLILRAPKLVSVNAGYNFLPTESLAMICTALKCSKGKLGCLDLRGNGLCVKDIDISNCAEFLSRGKPIFILPPLQISVAPYDDDP